MPREIVMRWNQEVSKIVRSDSVRKFLAQEGLQAAGGPPEEFRDRIRNDSEKWKRVVKEANIRIR
jgi:tripartite-type tricarboxylate transporter receptor subunit TctC